MINFNSLSIQWKPFPFGEAVGVFESDVYEEMISTFPPFDLTTKTMPNDMDYVKFSLNSWCDPKAFDAFVQSSPLWTKFSDYIESTQFCSNIADALKRNRIELTLQVFHTRFEFSFLPAVNGNIKPHVDMGHKILGIVIPIVRPGEWKPEWRGGTEMLAPPDENGNHEILHTCEFKPNVLNVHCRVPDVSWHRVICEGPPNVMRKSITINLMDHSYTEPA